MPYLLTLAFLFPAQPSFPSPKPVGKTPRKTAAAKTQAAKTAAAPAPAPQEPDDKASQDEDAPKSRLYEMLHSGALGYLWDGGIFMWPILILGIIAVGVIIERYRSLRMLVGDSSRLRNEVRKLLQEDRIVEALELCEEQEGPVPAILAAGLRKYLLLKRLNYDPAKIEEQVVKAMDDYSVHVVAALEKHLPILGTVSSAAPMLGFLGTVAGMIVSFTSIKDQFGEQNIVLLAADGIAVALLTTAFGLIVGIPAFVAFNYFSGVINRFILEVEESATELIEVVTMHVAVQQKESENGATAERVAAASE